MRPKSVQSDQEFLSCERTRMSAVTSYDDQRRRLSWLEANVSFRRGVPAAKARDIVAGRIGLSADQVRNIIRGRLKGLYGDVSARIDGAFVALAERALKDLAHDVAIAARSSQGIDPGVVDRAQATKDAIEDLLRRIEKHNEDIGGERT